MYGKQRLLVVTLITLIVGTVLAGTASSLPVLIAASAILGPAAASAWSLAA